MANDSSIKTTGTGSSQNLADMFQPSQSAADAKKTASESVTSLKKNDQISQKEFLTLLVNQLQNQDPLNPMDNQEFAVQLAQFSSLEQLVQINGKVGGDTSGSAGSSAASMASFLGNEVVVSGQELKIAKNKGPNLFVDFPSGIQSARVDLLGPDGKLAGSFTVEGANAGKQALPLDGLSIPDGSYTARIKAVDAQGKFFDVPSKVTGTVEGFVLQPEPALIVDGQEVKLEDVSEVWKTRQ